MSWLFYLSYTKYCILFMNKLFDLFKNAKVKTEDTLVENKLKFLLILQACNLSAIISTMDGVPNTK